MFREIRTVLLPDKNLLEKSLALARNLSTSDGLRFVIDNNNFIPHVTLYDAEFPESNFEKLLDMGEDLGKLLPLDLTFDKFFYGWDGYVAIFFKKTNQIYNFHKLVLEKLNPLRNGHQRNKYKKNQSDLVLKYGYHNVLENFEPHLTLGRFNDDKKAEVFVKELNNIKLQNFTADSFAFTETGKNGTVTKIIKKYG